MDDWVFVDTCIWSSFFTKPSSPEKRAVDELLDADRIALVGPVVAEVLLGVRRTDKRTGSLHACAKPITSKRTGTLGGVLLI